MSIMTKEINSILADVKFPGMEFITGDMGDGGFIQVKFNAACNFFPEGMEEQKGRKWYISPWATDAEVVQTCLKAVLTALEHEARETFLYKGVPVFQPHIDIEKLVTIARFKIRRESKDEIRNINGAVSAIPHRA